MTFLSTPFMQSGSDNLNGCFTLIYKPFCTVNEMVQRSDESCHWRNYVQKHFYKIIFLSVFSDLRRSFPARLSLTRVAASHQSRQHRQVWRRRCPRCRQDRCRVTSCRTTRSRRDASRPVLQPKTQRRRPKKSPKRTRDLTHLARCLNDNKRHKNVVRTS